MDLGQDLCSQARRKGSWIPEPQLPTVHPQASKCDRRPGRGSIRVSNRVAGSPGREKDPV